GIVGLHYLDEPLIESGLLAGQGADATASQDLIVNSLDVAFGLGQDGLLQELSVLDEGGLKCFLVAVLHGLVDAGYNAGLFLGQFVKVFHSHLFTPFRRTMPPLNFWEYFGPVVPARER